MLLKCCTHNMPGNLENTTVATGLENVSFHSNPKERQYQRMFKLLHNCPHFTCQQQRRQWQPTPVLLPGKSHGWRSLVGCHLWGGTEPDTTEVTAAAAAHASKVMCQQMYIIYSTCQQISSSQASTLHEPRTS